MPLYFLNGWNNAGRRLRRAERIINIKWWRKNIPIEKMLELANETADHILNMQEVLERKGLDGVQKTFNQEFPFSQDATPENFDRYVKEYLAGIKLLTGVNGNKFVEGRRELLEAMKRGNKEAPGF